MNTVVSVNPFRCRVWRLHSRLDELITEESCSEEIESFIQHGQLVPALGRRLPRGSDHDVELIYGARRLFVARLLNKPLDVELRDISDRDAIVAMDIENRHRTDISAYERGVGYARWLQEGLFHSQDEIAAALQISASQVSRSLRLARLPREVVDAFASSLDLCEGWGLDLAAAADDVEGRSTLVETAKSIASITPKPQARAIYRRLRAAATNSAEEKGETQERVIKGQDDAALFRIRRQRDSFIVILPRERLSAKSLEIIERSVAMLLKKNVQLEIAPAVNTRTLHAASV